MVTDTQLLSTGRRKGKLSYLENTSPTVDILFPLRGKSGEMSLERSLSRKSLVHLKGDHRGEKITCVAGMVWVTQAGNPVDVILHSGDTLSIQHKGTILIESLDKTRLMVCKV